MAGFKPLNRKNYGSIGHLPSSRMGPGDHHVTEGQARICTTKARRDDVIITLEKLDGSNVGITKVDGKIYPLTRAGYVANTSPYEMHHIFHDWVMKNEAYWNFIIPEHFRYVGEWLAQAHGTRYTCPQGPFVLFDIFDNRTNERCPWWMIEMTAIAHGIALPKVIGGAFPMSIEEAMDKLGNGNHGCIDDIEGIVYRIEKTNGKVDFLAKWVRPDKKDGIYLPEVSGKPAVWNWREE